MQGSGWIPARDDSIRLPDGRALAYAEWGDLGGRPVFYFHGMPGSRLFIPDPDAAADEHVRVIAADRPGMGRSDPQPGHVVADWPADVIALADALGLDRFGVIGWSAGVPYAFACAALIPERLTAASATTSAAAMRYLMADDPALRDSLLDDDDRAIFEALPQGRDAAEELATTLAAGFVEWLTEHPEQLVDSEGDPGDEAFLDDPAERESFVDSIREAVRQGAAAFAPQYVAQIAPWGFRLEDITMPVTLWHGEEDVNASTAGGRYMAQAIPNCNARFFPGEGHMAFFPHMNEMLDLVAAAT